MGVPARSVGDVLPGGSRQSRLGGLQEPLERPDEILDQRDLSLECAAVGGRQGIDIDMAMRPSRSFWNTNRELTAGMEVRGQRRAIVAEGDTGKDKHPARTSDITSHAAESTSHSNMFARRHSPCYAWFSYRHPPGDMDVYEACLGRTFRDTERPVGGIIVAAFTTSSWSDNTSLHAREDHDHLLGAGGS
jgi:hypothetical protein